MGKGDSVEISIGTVKEEVLHAIKEKVKEVTDSNPESTVQLKNVSVIDAFVTTNGTYNNLRIHSIFLDDNGDLCGDFTSENDGMNCGLIFGKSLEKLYLEDLYKILTNLYNGRWYVVETENDNDWNSMKKSLKTRIFGNNISSKILQKGA